MYIKQKKHGSFLILFIFLGIVLLLGVITSIHYWNSLCDNQDSLLFNIWLFLIMVFGMFVQVLSSNYRSGKPLFEVDASQLIFPLLFSIIVFYPICTINASSTHSFFSIYTAFLNGYFWESVVSSTYKPSKIKHPNLI